MNDALRMQVSAFVDGELPEAESELLMRRLSQDRLLRELVADYLSIGRLIRRDRSVPGIEGLRGRIQAALGEQPPEESSSVVAPRNRFLRPVAGVAVASVVATVALLGLRQVEVPESVAPTTVVQEPAIAAGSAGPGYTEPQPAEVMNSRPSEMLMQYYLSHGATSRDLGANGILTRLVTLELREGELVENNATDDVAQSNEGEESGPAARPVRDQADPEQ